MPDPVVPKYSRGKEYYCKIELTVKVMGGKWKPIILWNLAEEGVLRFGEIKRIMPNISQKMLTKQLRELESDDLIHREVFAVVPPKVEYSLTEFGETIMPILTQMCEWGQTFEERFRC